MRTCVLEVSSCFFLLAFMIFVFMSLLRRPEEINLMVRSLKQYTVLPIAGELSVNLSEIT